MSRTSHGYYLGLMSGTSLDGVDVALVEVDRRDEVLGARLEAFLSVAYEPEQRRAIREGLAGGTAELCRLNVSLGDWHAVAAERLLDEADFDAADLAAVGSHGHTIWHEPPEGDRSGATLQLGEPAVIAERLGVPVISDFRARDVAAGGHGAPLVPLVDQLLFSAPTSWRALQNIGGIANVSVLPPAAAAAEVIAFDTGPGVMVIDEVVRAVSGGDERLDVDGKRARRGRVGPELLADLLDDPFFRRRPPKSTGREAFGEAYTIAFISEGRQLGLADDDLVTTATALTAHSIADAYGTLLPDHAVPAECIVSGGGARNPALMQMLAERLAPIPVTDLSALGWDPDAKEAAAFAILAHLFQAGLPGNLPSVTGAAGPRLLGKLTPP
ncbi:MAG: anhydro-N-acetylmuramic acid kinase [Gemmatimonadetes bacterium]|uniref:Anhydro-N-acetylmuramic acid kinase n=1 Tax=Candidatus Kutchimonas denitrificans TaxID=3056748 RepID=A0AAE4Z8X7_9BACT|nr:anhydro-N-acetylmuramic acid kinase [Gemmatimonadota bacterium]NIR74346.1 anhydro-N-acetylmuramic acid kinase [Candidatus Kutchimonas denitrificans]NIS02597.1 anhydro-N-acetylmuramic acid kinase [Gemmatimonadota bacterium]NIT68472.1 anhydro-N-acetylmuramic acid kinase [Gemmatimonadota bacterium]NIU51949.1 anhydro-N-acetylmuramic acid kinase [Gemmatimonadota bacterium]